MPSVTLRASAARKAVMTQAVHFDSADAGVTSYEGGAKAKAHRNPDFSTTQDQAEASDREGIQPGTCIRGRSSQKACPGETVRLQK